MVVKVGPFCRKGFSYCRRRTLCDVPMRRQADTDGSHAQRSRQAAKSCPAGRTYRNPRLHPGLSSQRAENSNPRRNRKRGNSRAQQWEMEILNGDRVDGYELRCERVRRKFRPDIATVAAGVVGGDAFKLTDSRSTASGGVKRSSRGRKMTIRNSGRYQRT